MAKFAVNTHRNDPCESFKFRILWDGKPIAGIMKVSGLHRITEVIEYREGGETSNVRKIQDLPTMNQLHWKVD